jgi:hypothetical protein
MNPWLHRRGLPPHAAAVLAALHLDEPSIAAAIDWSRALDYADRARLTLALRDAAADHLPAAARERLDTSAAANAVRLAGIEETYRNLAAWLSDAGVDFLALKGLTHCALFGSAPESRVQYDVDLWLPRETVDAAQRVLMSRGYESMPGMENAITDHLPALIRKTGWEWRGDFFDAEIPLAIELHFQFWNDALERLPAPGVEAFWSRRTVRMVAATSLQVLSPPDALAYAALHLLKHLLRGSAKPFHVYELACILETLASDDAFWQQWRALHPPQLRRLQAVAFRLAREWFGGRAAPLLIEEIDRLPARTGAWFAEFSASPVLSEFSPNKDELWLHLSLLDSRRDALYIVQRRLLPRSLPAMNETAFVPESQLTLRRRAVKQARWLRFAAGRTYHHVISLARATVSGARWWWRTRSANKSNNS